MQLSELTTDIFSFLFFLTSQFSFSTHTHRVSQSKFNSHNHITKMVTLNCYISVTSSSTPISKDSTNTPPSSPPTKIILPKKKPMKWSNGVGPGEYGGPPPTTKLRKYWGGEVDPLATDDFIWNKDFMSRMKKLVQDSDLVVDDVANQQKEENSGFLSLNRVMSLDNMEIDLSKELTAPSPVKDLHVEEIQVISSASPKWRPAPTRREQEKWDRATKATTGGTDVMLRETRRPKGDPKVLAAQSREQYFKLKNKLQLITLGIGGVSLVSTYISYSPEIAASYGAGFLGSLVYIRMLGNSVDSMADGARGVIKGAIGQPRLLVPVALVMIFNRWNGIVVPEYGFMHLELIPMLVGFFTYKIATFYQAIEEFVTFAAEKNEA